MPVFWQEFGGLTGDNVSDLKRLADYIATIQEQVEFQNANIQRRLAALEERAGIRNGMEKE
jgi:hypothetical protein